jgi:hypothetical protein
MLGVTTVSYKFNIHGRQTEFIKAKRGLRQGDPISPLLFVIVMEYLHRKLQTLSQIPDFNFHSKCEKLEIIHLSFADDLLIFTRGDAKSVDLVMAKLQDFSLSTGLVVNPSKCKVYYGVLRSMLRYAFDNQHLLLMVPCLFAILVCPLLVKSFPFITTCPWWTASWIVSEIGVQNYLVMLVGSN